MAGWRCLTSPTPSRSPAMTEVQGKLSVAAAKERLKGSPDGLREVVRAVLQEVLEAEMTDALGAAKGERTAARLGYRSGYYSRTRPWCTDRSGWLRGTGWDREAASSTAAG